MGMAGIFKFIFLLCVPLLIKTLIMVIGFHQTITFKVIGGCPTQGSTRNFTYLGRGPCPAREPKCEQKSEYDINASMVAIENFEMREIK